MAVGATHDALFDLCQQAIPWPCLKNHEADVRDLGRRVYVVEFQTPDVALTTVDAWVFEEIPRNAVSQLITHALLAFRGIRHMLQAIRGVPFAATVSAS